MTVEDQPAPPEGLDLTKLDKPPLIFEFNESGHEPIKMTYGLEMDLRRVLPDPRTAVQLVLYDNFTQDYIIRRCLTAKKQLITDLDDLIPADEVEVTSEEADGLLKWALEHALYFFASRTAGVADLTVRFAEIFPKKDQASL